MALSVILIFRKLVLKRLDACLEVEGDYFEQLLQKQFDIFILIAGTTILHSRLKEYD